MSDFIDRMNSYDKDYCWQYEMRLNNLDEDISKIPQGVDYKSLTVNDFVFKPLTTKSEKLLAGEFIKRHEWLGKLAFNTTHYFGAFYGDILCGVITMGCPNAFSKCMGEDTEKYERLISRGACISWSPRCLASHFMMWCIKWMVHNTDYRMFSAYSDPMAKELGTIYQACNFYYLGNKFGSVKRYISPYSGKLISDRSFRVRSYYKRYAQDLGIPWQDNWSSGDKIYWDNMPKEVELKLRQKSKEMQESSQVVIFPSKHKYVYVLGRDKKETKELRKIFESHTKTYKYPKERGK